MSVTPSFEGFLEFCRCQNPFQTFDYEDNERCAFAQYLESLPGYTNVNVGVGDYNCDIDGVPNTDVDMPPLVQDGLDARHDNTFGGVFDGLIEVKGSEE